MRSKSEMHSEFIDVSRRKAPSAGTVVLDFPTPLLFTAPRKVLIARTVAEVEGVLREVDRLVAQGLFVAGYLSYEAGFAFEAALKDLRSSSEYPLVWFGVFEAPAAHQEIHRPGPQNGHLRTGSLGISTEQYRPKIDCIREAIASGEFYQLNFTDAIEGKYEGEAWDIYNDLHAAHPVPFGAFIKTQDVEIASLSPELFFARERERIWMRPMKGTAARGRTLAEDSEIAARLANDEKNRAENIMIVDLVRNDLGRICETGSVHTEQLCDVERFATVHQMTSTVAGTLRAATKPSDIVRALFPSGSVTGAPKLRTMEWIARLERTPRGVYTGAIGYFGPNEACMNVAIRTLVMRGGRFTLGVGSGITFDSNAEEEYRECEVKASFLKSVERSDFALIESLLWDEGYCSPEHPNRLEAHIARLRASAEYFDFSLDELRLRDALQQYGTKLAARCKVRLELSRDGTCAISHTEIARPIGRVMIASSSVHSSDRLLFHKTTRRETYERALQEAKQNDCDDALLFNERKELTEGAVHNVFIREREAWITPPVRCGLLAGIARAELLATLPSVREEVISRERLLEADEVWICNAVRGFYRVELVTETSEVKVQVADRTE